MTDHYPAGSPALGPMADGDRSWLGLWRAVRGARYRPGWTFRLKVVPPSVAGVVAIDPDKLPELTEHLARHLDQGRRAWPPVGPWGLPHACVILLIDAAVDDSAGGGPIVSVHPFAAPPPGVTPWARWLLDRIGDVERHETEELFTIDGKRPYPPGHNHLLTYAVPG